ncbi:hypothetical protein [Candidatus Viridilinea mediisalina]|uniref:Uncharacterized protein n=1 Tax=Candidatus Viridilinea mediisalina TaxID=2024553 RepID=A0A2A6RK66_9CHLR|nr:hypothetical protein [Candidatus Viridilinea mediisalina]PDW03269.1 hypothetical protein CJ255_09805 [Candidatus Viridilinea mediisalina]
MLQLKTLRTLSAIDRGSILADPLLRGLLLVPLMVALAVRGLLPLILEQVAALVEVELTWLFAPMAGYIVVTMAPLLAGTVIGFLLLDQRDDRTFLALRVTPLPLGLYLSYRLALPIGIAVLISLVAVALAGGQGLGLGGAWFAALAAAPLAPVTALGLVAFARNKLEGMALMKTLSILLAAPLAGLFMPLAGWSLPLLLLPTFWVAQATWALQAGTNPWGWIAGSWCISGLLLFLLLRRFQRMLLVQDY